MDAFIINLRACVVPESLAKFLVVPNTDHPSTTFLLGFIASDFISHEYHEIIMITF